jgi:folate-dependent phosphoribosylglycinamide formyltransferase PurN
MKWVALFSQTGSEICQVSELLGRYPDLIISNATDFIKINDDLIGKAPMIFTEKKPTVEEYLQYIPEDALVTMHGWLRIVPSEVCEKRNIYNGHPGLITKYPELKGKDPQLKAYKMELKTSGCIIHKAIPEVDSGEIILEKEVSIEGLWLSEVIEKLHDTSIQLWVKFLTNKIK